jgi:hypothetical protein
VDLIRRSLSLSLCVCFSSRPGIAATRHSILQNGRAPADAGKYPSGAKKRRSRRRIVHVKVARLEPRGPVSRAVAIFLALIRGSPPASDDLVSVSAPTARGRRLERLLRSSHQLAPLPARTLCPWTCKSLASLDKHPTSLPPRFVTPLDHDSLEEITSLHVPRTAYCRRTNRENTFAIFIALLGRRMT